MILTFKGSTPQKADVKSFKFEAPEPLGWEAGQFIHYTLPHDNPDDRGIKRWFTISSAPSQKEIVITTRIVGEKASSFKKALDSLQPGDTIEAEVPEGDFTAEDTDRNYLWIAGGIGVTPFHSILVEAAAKGQSLKVNLLYASRTTDITFKDEFDQLQQKNPNLKIDYVVEPNRIDEALLKTKLNEIENPFVYVSGPEPMVEALTEQIEKLGISKDNIKGDYFPGYEGV